MKDHRRPGALGPSVRLWLLVCLLILAFRIRAGSLTAQSFWRDEVDALCYAHEFPQLLEALFVPGQELQTPFACPPPPVSWDPEGPMGEQVRSLLGGMIRQNGPLYYFLLRGWLALTGLTEYAARYFSLLLGVLCVPLLFALGARLLDRWIGLVAATLLAFSPYLVWYSQEVKMYTLVPALALLALYGLLRAVERGGKGWALPVVATSLLLYTHIWGALLIPLEGLWLALTWPRWRRHWRGALTAMALLILPYLPLALWQVPSVWVRRETGFPYHTLGEMALILLNGWSTGIVGRGWPWGALMVGGTAAFGFVWGLHGTGRRPVFLLLSWLLLPLLAIWSVSLRQPLFTDRYLIWCAPALYLLTAAGWIALARKRPCCPLAVGLGAAVLLIFGLNLHAQATLSIKSDVRAAARYVEAHYQPDDLLIFQIPHVRYTFDYYFGPIHYRWADGLYTNHRNPDGTYVLSPKTAALWMAYQVGESRTVWLIASEGKMWDERNLVQAWLEYRYARTDEAHFTRVSVYRYMRPNE
ncbi:MAG: hypothetical protein D6793_11510 [Thermoflexia bacterium]|nr:MAG: hypothetical protein D6793_11510 [Thermoflexia bacterium]